MCLFLETIMIENGLADPDYGMKRLACVREHLTWGWRGCRTCDWFFLTGATTKHQKFRDRIRFHVNLIDQKNLKPSLSLLYIVDALDYNDVWMSEVRAVGLLKGQAHSIVSNVV